MLDHERQAMLAHDERHWWYRGRRRVLRVELDRLPARAPRTLLDVGCGSGRMLEELAAFGAVSGVDPSPDAVHAACARDVAEVRQAAAEALPFADACFDVVTCLDVLEHTLDDRLALRELRRVTRSSGWLIVTVPAYPRLWSRHDDVNGHRRRYTRAALRSVAAAAGWEVVRWTHFNAILLPPAAALRLAQRVRAPREERSDLERTPAALNRLLEMPLVLEAALLRTGARLPAGLSLLAVLRPLRVSATRQTPAPPERVAAPA